MNGTREFVLSVLAYAGVTFPLAYAWHLVVFEKLYRRLRFVTVPEPNVPLGFFTILSQGLVLAAVYPRFGPVGSPVATGLVFGLAIGALFWTAATVAHVAKHDVGEPLRFVGMEGAYFALNFAAYGALMGWIHG